MSRPAPPRTSGSCYFCNVVKRQGCSATQPGGTYPCKRCVDTGQDLSACYPHRDHPEWVDGVSGATHVGSKGKKRSGVTKTTSSKKTPAKPSAAGKSAPPPKKPTAAPSRPVRATRRNVVKAGPDPPEDDLDIPMSETNNNNNNQEPEDEDEDEDENSTVASRYTRDRRTALAQTGINPEIARVASIRAEREAFFAMTLGELRVAFAEERSLMGADGQRRIFEPPPGPDHWVIGDLVDAFGNVRPGYVPVKEQVEGRDEGY